MSSFLAKSSALPPCDGSALEALQQLEDEIASRPQITLPVEHHLHAGVYSRTVFIPKGIVACGVIINRPTQLIMSGHCRLTTGDKVVELEGFHVLDGEGHRKQIAYALEDTYFTMLFATNAKTVEEAETEFTDEADRLQTRNKELLCQV